ncbi:MAG: ABC transporter permease [Cyclobacteriaceae bacterium]
MIKNYLSIALRNIRQNPLYAFINIASLAIGLAACLVIYLFIAGERSFDAFHSKKENIYRLDEVQNLPVVEICIFTGDSCFSAGRRFSAFHRACNNQLPYHSVRPGKPGESAEVQIVNGECSVVSGGVRLRGLLFIATIV